MSERTLIINQGLIVDNPDEQQVEFVGEIDGDEFQFAISYTALGQIAEEDVEEDPIGAFHSRGTYIASLAAEQAPFADTYDGDLVMIDVDRED